jgi:hypothetical protein
MSRPHPHHDIFLDVILDRPEVPMHGVAAWGSSTVRERG